MDPAGCLEIFERSIEKHSMRYTEFLGNGDSKAHNQLIQDNVHGEIPVEKLECVGHIQKRMSARLRSLRKGSGKKKLVDRKSL